MQYFITVWNDYEEKTAGNRRFVNINASFA